MTNRASGSTIREVTFFWDGGWIVGCSVRSGELVLGPLSLYKAVNSNRV